MLHERIQASGRLVEHQQLGRPQEGQQKSELAPVARRQLPVLAVQIDLQPLGQLVPAARIVATAKPPQRLHHLRAGRLVGQPQLPGQVGEARSNRHAVAMRIQAQDADPSGIGSQKVQDAADGRALARAVGAQEPQDLASPHFEADAPDGVDGPIVLDQALDSEHRVGRGTSLRPKRFDCLAHVSSQLQLLSYPARPTDPGLLDDAQRGRQVHAGQATPGEERRQGHGHDAPDRRR